MIEKAVDIITSVAVKLIELFILLAVFGLVIDIVYPESKVFALIDGLGKTMTNFNSFGGFLAFILLIMFYEKVCKKS
jgi:hypothetical protein